MRRAVSRAEAEVAVTVLVYVVALALTGLSNVWLSVWGRRLSVLNTYFRSHQPLVAGDEGGLLRVDPFDLAALEASMSAAAAATGSSQATCDYGVTSSPVFDLGLHFLPHLHVRWLPDAFVFLLLPLLIAAVFVPATAVTRARRQGAASSEYWQPTLSRLCCVLQSHSVILLMRASTTLTTVHRASPVCHALSLESAANPGFVLNTGCFDLMFSGHTAFCVLAAFFVCHRPELGWAAQCLVAVVAAAGSVSNVLVGDHFTADCLVGAHIALLACCLYRHRFKSTLGRATVAPEALHEQPHAARIPTLQVERARASKSVTTRRSASRIRGAACDRNQLMEVDELQPEQDGIDMDISPHDSGEGEGGGRWSGGSSPDDGDAAVEQKELEHLVDRWQLADLHTSNSTTTSTERMRRPVTTR